MEYLVTGQEMQHYDAYTINEIGVPALVLMERAALAVVEELFAERFNLQNVAVVCGYGNNGGDGVAIARLLTIKGVNVTLYFVGDPQRATDSTQRQINIAEKYRVQRAELPATLSDHTTIVDALFGVGLSRAVEGEYADAIETINQSGVEVLAVDIPSGVSADSGKIMNVAVKAKQTVTFAYKKLGQALYPGSEYCGKVTVKDIGINDASFADKPPAVYSYCAADLPSLLPVRPDHSNKGTFGKLLVIAGSQTMSGAAYLSAKAAYKTGAGLVRIYTPEANRAILLTQLPEAILTTYDPANVDLEALRSALDWATAIAIGPGMSTETSTKQILAEALNRVRAPMVIDADALNVLAKNTDLLRCREQPVIVTPHVGEMARLVGKEISEVSQNLIKEAKSFAEQYRLTCVLKDARTIVASEQEPTIYLNQSGNNGMATGGSGDVLTGIIAGLIAQRCEPKTAATLGVYLHGLAGDRAKEDLNQYGMLAEDIIDGLIKVMKPELTSKIGG